MPLLSIQKQPKKEGRDRVYEKHLSAGIHREAFVDRSEVKIDTFTFNMIRHLMADINKRQGLRIDAKLSLNEGLRCFILSANANNRVNENNRIIP